MEEDKITITEYYVSTKDGKTTRVRVVNGQVLDVEEMPVEVVNFDYRSSPWLHGE